MSASAPVLVDKKQRNASNTTIVATVPVAGVAAGHVVSVGLLWNTLVDPTSVVDSKGNTYTQDKAAQDTHTSTKRIAAYSAQITTPLVSGDTITATWAVAPSRSAIIVWDCAGLLSSGIVDVTATNGGAGPTTTLDCGSVATTQADELWMVFTGEAIAAATSFTLTPDGSFTGAQMESTNAASVNVGLGSEYQIVSATGTMHPAPTSDVSSQWVGICVAYKATGSSAPTNTVAPAITGGASRSLSITSDNGTWTGTPTGYTYQWKRETGVGTGVYSNIGGQTAASYTCLASDLGLRLICAVTATNASGSATAQSAPAGPVGNYLSMTPADNGFEICSDGIVATNDVSIPVTVAGKGLLLLGVGA